MIDLVLGFLRPGSLLDIGFGTGAQELLLDRQVAPYTETPLGMPGEDDGINSEKAVRGAELAGAWKAGVGAGVEAVVVEEGTYQTLMRQAGYFSRMTQMQTLEAAGRPV